MAAVQRCMAKGVKAKPAFALKGKYCSCFNGALFLSKWGLNCCQSVQLSTDKYKVLMSSFISL